MAWIDDLEDAAFWVLMDQRRDAKRQYLRDKRCVFQVWDDEDPVVMCGEPGQEYVNVGDLRDMGGHHHFPVYCSLHAEVTWATLKTGWRPIEEVPLPM